MVKVFDAVKDEKVVDFDRPDEGPKPGKLERLFNFLICRCDLNKEPLEAQPVSFKDLFLFGSKTDKICVVIGIICGTLAGALYNFPYFIGGKISTALIYYGQTSGNEKLISAVLPWVGINLFLAVSVLVLTFFQTFLLKRACTNITATLRIKFIEALLRQDAVWLDEQKFGVLNAQLTESIDVIRDGIGEKVALVVRGISGLVGCCIFSAYVDWKSFLMVFGCAPLSVILMSFMAKLISVSSKKLLPHSEKAASILQESLINVKTVQGCNGENEMVQRFGDALKNGRGFSVLNFVWNGFFDGTTFFVLYIFFSSTFYYCAVMYYKGEIGAPGDVFIVPNSFFGAAYTMAIVSPHFVAILKARVAAATIYAKINRVPRNSADDEELFDQLHGGSISFKDVHFSYKSGHKVLKGLSFEAAEGATTALVGHSGCGKSTTIALLTKLYECDSGKICIDGINIRQGTIAALRKIIGIVRQEPVLFSGTIADNIRLGDESITDDAIHKACKMANAHDFIEKLANGYDTLIGSGAVQLSGGQKQRIAIARAIVNDPKILLLDEATSALDGHSEVLVQSALKAATSGRTTIVIAHRLSTLRDANKIVVINDGQVLEEGTHESLKVKGGLYAQLVKAQEFKEKSQTVKEAEAYSNLAKRQRRRSSNAKDEEYFPQGSVRSGRPNVNLHSTIPEPAEPATVPHEHGLMLIYKNSKAQKGKLIAATIGSILRGFELPLFTFSLTFVFNELGNKGDWEPYRNSMLLFWIWSLCLGVYSFFTIFVPTSLYGWAAVEVVDALKIRALATFLRKDAAFFDQKETSNAKLVAKINSDAPQIISALDHRLVHFVNNSVALVLLLIQGAIFCWQVVLIGSIAIVIMMAFMTVFGRLAHRKMNKISQLNDSANLSVEIIENTRTIQLLCRESYFLSKFKDSVEKLKKESITASMMDGLVLGLGFASVYVCDFLSYGVGAFLIYGGYATASGVFLSSMNVTMTSWAIQFASWSLIDIFHAKPAAESLIPLIDENIGDDGIYRGDSSTGIHKVIEGKVEVRNVNFAYPARPDLKVAHGLNFKIEEGKTAALVGPSGGGKSTIIQLLERFYQPQSGHITVDKTDIQLFNLQNLRKQMALVGQEPVLFSGSIIDNISMGVPEMTIEEIKDACKMANAAKFIEQLPLGYDTEVGEKGALLSGGQKQRIAIARAVARKPKILLLDEATSALDSESERLVQEALEVASQSRTCITIAHRLSSIQNSDKIYFIQGGKVVEAGTHDELIEAGGKYADLVKKQELNS